ncbi:MAG: glycosyltransferase family 4 protein [Saprospiraceae bacterium]
MPNLKVILVGGGSIEKELKDKSKKLNIEEYVDFPGYLPPEELPSYINASDICIIPHLKSGHTDNTIPHKLFQYMILQKLVIGSDCNPIKRIIYETKAGIVYKNDSPIELAKAVIKAYYMDRAKIGLNGKNAVVTKYNWASTVKTLLEIYDYKNL